jgi:CheY-like chemotaxis protein
LIEDQPSPSKGRGDVSYDLIQELLLHSQLRPEDEFLTKELITEVRERRSIGIERYGTQLQYDNGRDAFSDMYQEIIDGMMYCQQLKTEECYRRQVKRLAVAQQIFVKLREAAVLAASLSNQRMKI